MVLYYECYPDKYCLVRNACYKGVFPLFFCLIFGKRSLPFRIWMVWCALSVVWVRSVRCEIMSNGCCLMGSIVHCALFYVGCVHSALVSFMGAV